MMTNPRRSRLVPLAAALAGGWAVAAVAPAARGQMLDQCPADAGLVVKINHLADTNTKVAALLQQLGVTDLAPEAKDPLAAFEDKTGIPPASLDAKRDGGFFMPNPTGTDADRNEPPLVLLLPVSDYKAFLAGLTAVRTEGDVSVVHFKDQTDDAFVAHWGDYAAIAPTKALLAGKHDGLKPTGAAGREMTDRDACLFVNFPVLKTAFAPKLAEGRTKVQGEAEQRMAGADAGKKQLAHAAIDQGFNVVDSFLRDAGPTTLGLTVGKAGVTQTLVVGFGDGSYLANLLGHLKTTDGPLLGGLPDEKYLFFGGSLQDPKKLTQLIDDLDAPILPKLDALGADGAKIRSLVDTYKSALVDSTGGSFGLVVPTAALGAGSLVRSVTVLHADAAKLKAAAEQGAAIQTGLMADLGVPGANLTKTTVMPDAKTVDGVHFDSIKTEIDPAANNGQAAQAQQFMSVVYGPDGPDQLVGVVNDKTLLTTLGVDDQLLGSAIESAKADKDVLTGQVKAVDAELPHARAAVSYLDLAQLVSTALSYAKANGLSMPIQLPPNLPPVGFALGNDPDGAALRFDAFMPTSLMQSLVQAGFQAYLNTPHGGGGGGL